MSILEGKVAFVTGAARGQGRAHAVKLAEAGADVIAVDLCAQIPSVPYPMATPDDLGETVELVKKTGARIVAEQADVRDAGALSAALQAGVEALGRLDIVVANAAIAPMTADNAWQDVIDVNLTGVYNTVAAAAPTMIAQGSGGSIALISSAAGLAGMGTSDAGSIGYTAAKHGVVGLMRVYANLLAPHSIRVNSVHPSGVDTPMINNDSTRQWLESLAARGGSHSNNLMNALPVSVLEPNDIAEAVLWLASDAARYVTGVTLPVDAGFLVNR
jgi:SDR family mycofactocin-dependent oxidoreductase